MPFSNDAARLRGIAATLEISTTGDEPIPLATTLAMADAIRDVADRLDERDAMLIPPHLRAPPPPIPRAVTSLADFRRLRRIEQAVRS